jgi:hypothetical protein
MESKYNLDSNFYYLCSFNTFNFNTGKDEDVFIVNMNNRERGKKIYKYVRFCI